MIIQLNNSKSKIKAVWGGHSVVTTCQAIIIDDNDNVEAYDITFQRNQLTGEVYSITCGERMDTTEHTIPKQGVEDLVLSKLMS